MTLAMGAPSVTSKEWEAAIPYAAACASALAPATTSYPLVPFCMGKGVLNGYSSTRISLWDSLMFGRVLEYP